ncbi:hypothetical protein [Streptomyces umbrinus]|uniref:hypothetical protein n=1 Tax=Streptomyces umbrinus TaxID=67370 RepID=UPI003402A09D
MLRTTTGVLRTEPGPTSLNTFVVRTFTTGSPTTTRVRALSFFPFSVVKLKRTVPLSPGLLPGAAYG